MLVEDLDERTGRNSIEDADRVPTYYYWIVRRVQENGNAVNMLEAGDWITSINGTSTTDRDKTFLEKVIAACQRDVLILVIRKPTEHQEFNLWDPNLDINDSNKTIALVDSIEIQKKYLKGRLKRGDKVIAINEHRLEDKTDQELQQIIHQLNPQQQFKLTIERRQWRQDGHLTRFAINSPAHLGWRRLQVELNRNPEVMFGFTFKINLNSRVPIITKIAAGETPAAMSSYISPGCKITAINGHPVKGLSFNNVKRMLLKAKTLSDVINTGTYMFVAEENDLPSGERRTWPVQAETGCLHTSLSEGQILYSNSFLADGPQLSIDLTGEQKQKAQARISMMLRPAHLCL
ncbi:hypothetical protein OS493_030808 [Desmophyllum pertusum]|uniref:PDZ domain-containing protein n=1 Tax=Desmophyllum pertusum TaxID=174260 RepID=A0A9W9YJQ6_9CNID|nr:hypothetical protein OS493_030808 [Desmophyllum pertusum]